MVGFHLNYIMALLSDILMFYIKYLTKHKVHMHAGATRQLLYGCAYVQKIIHSLKLVDFPPVYMHKPYNNLHELCLLLDFDILHRLDPLDLEC